LSNLAHLQAGNAGESEAPSQEVEGFFGEEKKNERFVGKSKIRRRR
jgi:hypothetical protein